jgi:hypothetical protein
MPVSATEVFYFLSVADGFFAIDTASPDDPNEISFTKGEVLDIVDKQGKWWQAKKADGTIGSTCQYYFPSEHELTMSSSRTFKLPSNHLTQILMSIPPPISSYSRDLTRIDPSLAYLCMRMSL